MILTHLSDIVAARRISIAARIRITFFFYALISFAATLYVWFALGNVTAWDIVYEILFPISVVTCLYMAIKPQIGAGSMYLGPLFLGALIRVIDIWREFFFGNIQLSTATLGSVGWSFLMISILYIDLLESRIYHRLVMYIEQETD